MESIVVVDETVYDYKINEEKDYEKDFPYINENFGSSETIYRAPTVRTIFDEPNPQSEIVQNFSFELSTDFSDNNDRELYNAGEVETESLFQIEETAFSLRLFENFNEVAQITNF